MLHMWWPWGPWACRVTIDSPCHVLVVPSGFYKITSLRLDVPLRITAHETRGALIVLQLHINNNVCGLSNVKGQMNGMILITIRSKISTKVESQN